MYYAFDTMAGAEYRRRVDVDQRLLHWREVKARQTLCGMRTAPRLKPFSAYQPCPSCERKAKQIKRVADRPFRTAVRAAGISKKGIGLAMMIWNHAELVFDYVDRFGPAGTVPFEVADMAARLFKSMAGVVEQKRRASGPARRRSSERSS